MADPLSVTSGLVALITFALQSSKLLYQTINSFRSSKRAVRNLHEEVESVVQVLGVLEQAATEFEAELSTLKLPLMQCGVACKELNEIISKCAKHSDGTRNSFRDWTKLQYMGDDIANFQHVLANYKATMNIALGGATFRNVAVTSRVLQEYKDMISNTTSDLQDRLEEIEGRFQALSSQEKSTPGQRNELDRINEERSTTQHCIQICDEVAAFINQCEPKLQERLDTATSPSQPDILTVGADSVSARRIADTSLSSCLLKLRGASSLLQDHLVRLETSLQKQIPAVSNEILTELKKIKEEREVVAQCLNICSDASNLTDRVRVSIYEDIASLDDSQQVIVSTIGDLLDAKRVSTGSRSQQIVGQLSDETLQSLSLHRSLPVETAPRSDKLDQHNFQARHGTGRPLNPERSKRSGEIPGPGNPS